MRTIISSSSLQDRFPRKSVLHFVRNKIKKEKEAEEEEEKNHHGTLNLTGLTQKPIDKIVRLKEGRFLFVPGLSNRSSNKSIST